MENISIQRPTIDKFENLDLGQEKSQGPQLASAQLVQQQKKSGNPTGELASIKKAGEKEILTPEEFKRRAREIRRCKNDVLYFCRKYFKIVSLKDGLVTLNPYPKQAELLKFIQDNNRAIVCASRQVGKCQCADSTITIREVSTGWIETVTVGDFFAKYGFSHHDMDDSSGKFVDSVDVDGKYQILTDTVFDDVKAVHKTVKYDVWILRTKNHVLECADDHIVFDKDWNEVFVKNLNPGQTIWTEDGLEKVVEAVKTDRIENMYDVELPEPTNHRYYTNGILSHNTTIYTVYLLWYAMYHPDKRVMVCGNKLDIAIEIMDRIRLGYEYCPSEIKIGVTTYNKKCIEFENNSIIRCFATGSSGCRGFSANCVNKYSIITIRLFGWLKLKLPIFMLRWFGKVSDFSNNYDLILNIIDEPNGFLHESVFRTFEKQYRFNHLVEVCSIDGWYKVESLNLTEPIDVIQIESEKGRKLLCAKDHILYDENGNEIFAKDALGKKLITESGLEKIVVVNDLNEKQRLYDLSLRKNIV